jgi:hypothetical protein
VPLNQLTETCVFGDYLDEALQTQFINNVRSPRTKEEIEEGADKFHALVEKAARYEFQQTHSNPPAVNFIDKKQGKKRAKHQKHALTKQERPQKDETSRGASGIT